jgi:hypothetical protein
LAVHFSVVLPYPGVGTIGFIDQVKCTRYSKLGDSGSIIVDKKSGKIVGTSTDVRCPAAPGAQADIPLHCCSLQLVSARWDCLAGATVL